MTQQLAGKTCVVTGGGTGIGLGIARSLAVAGCRVAIAGRRREPLEQACRDTACNPPMISHVADVADLASVGALFDWASRELGPIDILVNAAGINVRRRAAAELEPDDLHRLIEINAVGAFYCIRAVLSSMRERGEGLIVNVSSVAGLRGSPLGGVGYSMSKFAMTGLGETIAREEGKHGIRVTNVYPGEVDTPMIDQRPVALTTEHRSRILQPDDVGAAVVMVAALPPRAHVPDLVIKPTWQDF